MQPLPCRWTWCKGTRCPNLLHLPHGPFMYVQDIRHSARVAALIISVLNDLIRGVSPISTYSASSVGLALPKSVCHPTRVRKQILKSQFQHPRLAKKGWSEPEMPVPKTKTLQSDKTRTKNPLNYPFLLEPELNLNYYFQVC